MKRFGRRRASAVAGVAAAGRSRTSAARSSSRSGGVRLPQPVREFLERQPALHRRVAELPTTRSRSASDARNSGRSPLMSAPPCTCSSTSCASDSTAPKTAASSGLPASSRYSSVRDPRDGLASRHLVRQLAQGGERDRLANERALRHGSPRSSSDEPGAAGSRRHTSRGRRVARSRLGGQHRVEPLAVRRRTTRRDLRRAREVSVEIHPASIDSGRGCRLSA